MGDSIEYDITPDDIVFFLHMPKTAGTTLVAILDQHLGHALTCPSYFGYEVQQLVDQGADLSRYRYWRGHLIYDMIQSLIDREAICLTMLRHPIQRLISGWAHVHRHPELSSTLPAIDQYYQKIATLSLDAFVGEANADMHWRESDGQTALLGAQARVWQLNRLSHTAQVRQQIAADDLARAIEQLRRCAWFGLTERFQESLALLAFTFGWRPRRDTLRLNMAPQRQRLEQIAPETLDRIIALNRFDLQLYQVATQLFDQRYTRMCHDLLARYGDQAHAQQRLPLPIHTVFELLERHYQARYSRRHPPVNHITLRFDQPIDGEGWHIMLERTQLGEPYRWIGPAPAASVDLPLATGHHYHISIRVVHTLSLDTLRSLRLTVNAIPVPLSAATAPDRATHFRGIIPAAALPDGSAFARLQFHIEQTARPEDSADDRLLGLAVSQICIEPTTYQR
jgi:hypothetical protein